MVIEEMIGDVKELRLCYEGSGDPMDEHNIVGIRYIDENGRHRFIGDYTKMLTAKTHCTEKSS